MYPQHIRADKRPPQSQAAQPTQKRPGGQSRRSKARQDKRTCARHRPSAHPKPKRHSQPQERPGGKAAAAAPSRKHAPTRDEGNATSPNPNGTADLKSVPAAKPPQQHSAGQTRPRKTKGLNTCVQENSPAQRESQDPNNPHPAAASRASGSNCGRRCTRTYPA